MIVSTYRYVHAAVGLHPELVGERHGEIALLEQLLNETPFVGEIGLDGSPPHRKTLPLQKMVFMRALAGAQRIGGRVLSIHSRRATKEVLECLSQQTTADRVLPILHWFSDSASVARHAAAKGCYFSINHRMLESESGVALVRSLPADRLLTETDAPFTEVRKQMSEPHDVLDTAQQLAAVRGVQVGEMTDCLRANADCVFAFAGVAMSFRRK